MALNVRYVAGKPLSFQVWLLSLTLSQMPALFKHQDIWDHYETVVALTVDNVKSGCSIYLWEACCYSKADSLVDIVRP